MQLSHLPRISTQGELAGVTQPDLLGDVNSRLLIGRPPVYKMLVFSVWFVRITACFCRAQQDLRTAD
jgi:hypothetical protein